MQDDTLTRGEDYGVAVPIVARFTHRGSTIAEVEGYALSAASSPEPRLVCLMEYDRNLGRAVIGAVVGGPFNGDRCVDPFERVLADELWREARKPETLLEIRDKFADYRRANRDGAAADAYRNAGKDAAA